MTEKSATVEAHSRPAQVNYPLTLEGIARLAPDSTIHRVPAEKIVHLLFEPVIEDSHAGDYALIQARRQMAGGNFLDAQVVRVNPAEQTITTRFTLPTAGNENLWGPEGSTRTADLPYSLFQGGKLDQARALLQKLMTA